MTKDLDELILRDLQGQATSAEARTLAAWLEAAPENRAYYEELQKLWQLAEGRVPAVRSSERPSARDLVRRSGESAPEREPTAHAGSPWPWRRLVPLAAAAGIAAVAVAVGVFLLEPGPPDPFFGVAEFSTGPRERVTVRLGDGSIVRLAESSSLELHGSRRARTVWLKGNAFFAVARQDDATFMVRTRAGTATVLGTRFDVHARDDELRLVVVDGRVRVEAGPEGQYAEEVGPSEMTRVVEGGRMQVSQVQDVYALLDWMNEALVFQATSLDRVAEELEYRYGVAVELEDARLATRTVTAWFTDEPIEVAVAVICRVAEVECEVSDTDVRIGI